MRINKKFMLLVIIVSSLIVGCRNYQENKLVNDVSIQSEQNNQKELTELQKIYFNIIGKCDKDDSRDNINQVMDSYNILNVSNIDNEEIFNIDNEEITFEYDDNVVRSISYCNNSEGKEFFTFKYNREDSKKNYSVMLRKNDLSKMKSILDKLDCNIVHFSLYNEYINIVDTLNINDNLKESDLKNFYNLDKFDYNGFYKKADDCYITIETISSNDKIFSLSIFYPEGDVAMQYLYSSKLSTAIINLNSLNEQKRYIEKLNIFF